MEDIPADVDSDGEDRRERNAYEIEEALTQFEDEPPILHNYTHNLMMMKKMKEAVLNHALRTCRNISQYKYDKTRVVFECNGKGCSWRIYCSVPKNSTRWQCAMLKDNVIARLFLDKIREEEEYFMPMKIEQLIMEKWRICVTRNQCQHARNKALRWIEREYAQQFSRLRDYATEIEHSNPGSSVEVDCITNEAGSHVFQRFYVCFNNLRRSWKENCRLLIGVDGCFLKSVQKGELFVANGRDADNRIYPIAWAVVQMENTNNWAWFFRKIKIKVDLCPGDGDEYVLVSDRQKGLLIAVKEELPLIEHRMCVRHIYMNVKYRHGKMPELKTLIWHLAWSYNLAEYKENLKKIEDYDEAVYADVMKMKPETWCRAFYKLGPYCEDVENNSVESFNNSIGKARDKALVPMLETIARLAMVRIAKREAKADGHQGLTTPYVSKYLAEQNEKAKECIVQPSTNKMFLAIVDGCSYRVNLEHWTCTCRKWQITGIPCEHAYEVIIKRGLETQDYVCKWFKTEMWRKLYMDGIVPVRGARF
ncbi:uncharacterized protein LOC112086105 [Eutrema salsugineum]|uniref:uncharacterized protein LOC112086105 n=1 Tax=Eutrema salsugineum TaxID=72664 RepID=UPI000CED56E0|nr:uncharacterized protein LOC112086105 [Eutrema salsugineum]